MKTITEMTRELGGFAPTTKFLEQFAELVRADERELVLAAAIDGAEHAARKAVIDEREACAKVCDALAPSQRDFDRRFYDGCESAATAIRAKEQA